MNIFDRFYLSCVLAAAMTGAVAGERIIQTEEVRTADETVYADRPYWYKPGHPLDPAESSSIHTLPGFKAERILTVPASDGSLTALAVDSQGRLLAAAQHEAGISRITPAPIDQPEAETKVEKLGGAAAQIGWAHGLLYAFDSLYVVVSEGNDRRATGVHRLRDTDGDGQFDESRLLFELKGSGEHGPHNLVVGPDGASLYLMCGNGTPLVDGIGTRRPVATRGLDRLQPPGFESSSHTPAGWVLRFDPDGGHRELICSGLRNSYDLAFNRTGDLFTFDSDMEWDLGAPWYRPTRICHLVSGGEFGWRENGSNWPEHVEDSVAPVVNIGPGSPTGIVFGYGTRFPARYQEALFVGDWTFATIHAVHLQPHGASYRGEVEQFVGGSGLPVTGITVGRDGALYFAVGGRRLGSAVYRVRYLGQETTRPVEGVGELPPQERERHAQRRELERFHGAVNPESVGRSWPSLGHADRALRFAARIAVETQPVSSWREKALTEADLDTSLTALLALARQGETADLRAVIGRLNELPWDRAATDRKLRALRVYELVLARGEDRLGESRDALRQRLRPLFPDTDGLVTRELSRLLCHLGDVTVVDPALALMAADTGGRPLLGSGYFVRNPKYGAAVRDMLESAPLMDRMHHAQMLLWIEDGWTTARHRRYFESIADAMANSKGGHQYLEFWERIRETALERIPEAEREPFEALNATPTPSWAEGLPTPEGPGREWSLEETLKVVGRGLVGRDPERGGRMYAAAGCALCHRFNGEGGAIGPDLSSIGQRFTLRDILDATLHPSKAISDQYQMTTLELADGTTLSGRLVSRDETSTRIATHLMRPGQSTTVPTDTIRHLRAEPVSTMPPGLLNPLNEDELLDLLAYLVAAPGAER